MTFMKARSCSLPVVRPIRTVPLGSDHPLPDMSRVSSSLAYELLRRVKMTPCVRTGSIVPNGGTVGGTCCAAARTGGFESRLLLIGGTGVDFGTASSTKRLCVGFACDCGSTTDGPPVFACAPPFDCELEFPSASPLLP